MIEFLQRLKWSACFFFIGSQALQIPHWQILEVWNQFLKLVPVPRNWFFPQAPPVFYHAGISWSEMSLWLVWLAPGCWCCPKFLPQSHATPPLPPTWIPTSPDKTFPLSLWAGWSLTLTPPHTIWCNENISAIAHTGNSWMVRTHTNSLSLSLTLTHTHTHIFRLPASLKHIHTKRPSWTRAPIVTAGPYHSACESQSARWHSTLTSGSQPHCSLTTQPTHTFPLSLWYSQTLVQVGVCPREE